MNITVTDVYFKRSAVNHSAFKCLDSHSNFVCMVDFKNLLRKNGKNGMKRKERLDKQNMVVQLLDMFDSEMCTVPAIILQDDNCGTITLSTETGKIRLYVEGVYLMDIEG